MISFICVMPIQNIHMSACSLSHGQIKYSKIQSCFCPVLFHRYPGLCEELEAKSMIIPKRSKHNTVESAQQC